MTELLTKEQAAEIAKNAAEMAVKAVLAMRPRPSYVNKSQAAEMLEVSPGAVTNLLKRGDLKQTKTGRIPVAQIDGLLNPL